VAETAYPQPIAANATDVLVVGAFGGSGTTLVLPGKTLDSVSSQDFFLTSFIP
jgi:hypothetical protein